jgi:HemY protein
MRGIVWLLLLFVVAVVAAATVGRNDGLVVLYWPPWRVDLSLNLFLLGLVGVCLVVYAVLHSINALIGLPRRAREWRVARRDRAAQAALREALALYFAGRYSRAHKAAARALDIQQLTPDLQRDTEFTALGHLLTAGSLHRLQDRPHRDEALERALQLGRDNVGARAVGEGARLLAAEWAIDDRDAPRALVSLAELPPGVARRTLALRLKLQAARLAKQPLEALKTARLLAKHQGLSSAAAGGLVRALAIEVLDAPRDAEQLRRAWQQLDAADRRDPYVSAHAARRAATFDAHADGRSWLQPHWERLAKLGDGERAALCRATVKVLRGLPNEWLALVEAALQQYPADPLVAFVAGMALSERQLWGRARRLLEFAGEAQPLDEATRREAWLELALMAEREGDTERARTYHRDAARVG